MTTRAHALLGTENVLSWTFEVSLLSAPVSFRKELLLYFLVFFSQPCIGDMMQAEYVRVPLADSTLIPTPENVTDKEALLVGDVLPTGQHRVNALH